MMDYGTSWVTLSTPLKVSLSGACERKALLPSQWCQESPFPRRLHHITQQCGCYGLAAPSLLEILLWSPFIPQPLVWLSWSIIL